MGPAPFFATPFSIGPVRVPNRVVLAPMAGLTTSAYRRHLKAHGAGLVTTEMVSAYGLVHGNRRTEDYLFFVPEERPIAVQLFGDTPEVMAHAARLVLEGRQAAPGEPAVRGSMEAPREQVAPRDAGGPPVLSAAPDMLDINMGCPVRKVVGSGAGCALLGNPDLAVAVAAAVVKVAAEYGVPVTVKLRSALREGERTVVALAPRLEAVGVAALGVHPRAMSQHYHGNADHSVTEAVVKAVGIPVMASGDVISVSSAREIVEATGAAAVMVARGATGDPWLVDALLAEKDGQRPALPAVVADLRALLAMVVAEMGDKRALKWMYRLIGWYLRPSRVPVPVIDALRAASDGRSLDQGLAALVD
jgi:tRNA-dihydrouridine synthase B